MHGITNIGAHSIASPSQGSATNALSSQSGSGFQLAALTNPSSQSVVRSVSSTSPPTLGSQTVSTLLQTQDLNQTQVRGGGGGGGHHGGVKMSLEAEEAEESEEAQILRQRKKLAKTIKSANASETAEVDENGMLAGDVEQTEESKLQNKEGGLNP